MTSDTIHDKNRPSEEEALQAIKTILRFIGENPDREGLIKTPKRILKSYKQMFDGYELDPAKILETKFYDTGNIKEPILLKNIKFKSFCEHHFLPIVGTVDISYIPHDHIVGISKLARIVDVFAHRLQVQEKMTASIANSLQDNLAPLGVAVRVRGVHSCMTMRGVMKDDSVMDTMYFTGLFTENDEYRKNFLRTTL